VHLRPRDAGSRRPVGNGAGAVGPFLLGIDIGTASSKAVLTTPDGTVVVTSSRPHAVSMPHAGHVEMDAEAVWWGDVVALCRDLVPRVPAGAIAGVCVSGLGPCLLLTDENLSPLRPAILYGIDMRAAEQIEQLRARYGDEQIIARGGTALSSQAVGPKMLWVRQNEPEVWQRARRWFNSNSYVVARLTGEYVLDHHTASQCDPLYDMASHDWAHDWVADVAGDLPMPRLAWPSDVVGTVQEGAATETGLPVGTPVSAGTVDAWAEAFSCGVRRPGDLMLMYGSTMFMVQVLDRLRTHPVLWTTAGVEPGSTTLAAGMSTSGSLTAWLQQVTGGAPFAELVEEAAAVPPGAEGLLLLPYFAGERTPIFDPRARGVIAGLTLRHGRGHLYRAAYEGIAFGVRQILELLDEAGGASSRIVAVGGGTQGDLWTQIVSDVTGREQALPTQTVGASYGDALLAAIGTGLVDRETDWTTIARTVKPDGSNTEVYELLYSAYCSLYPATREHVHLLAQVQESTALRQRPAP
jgi:xylulokinase